MPRSEEAMQRRAEKRQRTLQEQKKVDIEDVRKREKLEEASRTGVRPRSSFQAPRSYMNDSRPPPKKQLRHDPETSKALVWAEQADEDKISKNQALRNKYKQTGGEGMDPEELERAKLLIARDERKKLKKQKKNENPGENGVEEGRGGQESSEKVLGNDKTNQDGSSTETKDNKDDNGTEGKELSSKIPEKDRKKEHDAKCKKNAKANRDRNNALRKRYQETSGKGMSPADAKRAKQLLERDERKKQKRAAAVQTQ